MQQSLTKQLLLSSNYWVLNKTVVQLLGLETAFLLSNFAEAEQMMADEEGWFYQTSDTVEEMTTLSRHKQDQCIKQLEEMDILFKDIRGMPAKRYFKINYQCLTNLIVNFRQTSLRNIDKQDCEKLTTNKERINKKSINKEIDTEEVAREAKKENKQKEVLTKKDIDSIIDRWNELGLQNLRSVNPNTNRHKMLKARIKEYSFDDVIQAIENVKKSKFLQGQGKTGWMVTFDWIIKPNNFIKVLEGNYDDNVNPKGGQANNDNSNNYKRTKFHNFEQTSDKYSKDDLEDVARRKRQVYKDMLK